MRHSSFQHYKISSYGLLCVELSEQKGSFWVDFSIFRRKTGSSKSNFFLLSTLGYYMTDISLPVSSSPTETQTLTMSLNGKVREKTTIVDLSLFEWHPYPPPLPAFWFQMVIWFLIWGFSCKSACFIVSFCFSVYVFSAPIYKQDCLLCVRSHLFVCHAHVSVSRVVYRLCLLVSVLIPTGISWKASSLLSVLILIANEASVLVIKWKIAH